MHTVKTWQNIQKCFQNNITHSSKHAAALLYTYTNNITYSRISHHLYYVCLHSFSSGHHRFWFWWIFVNSQSSKNNRNNISWEKKYDITHTSGNSSKLSANYLSSLWIWFPFHFHSFSLHATMGRGILKVLSPNEYPAICW